MALEVTEALVLRLEGFEGPLDMLLELARGQKVDLTKISILDLVEQFLAVIEGARRVRLELAADWLVMAAWLTWLKSRLLVPQLGDGEEAEEAADILQARLVDLQAMRQAALWLGQRPQLNRDVFARGMAEDLTEIDRSRLKVEISGLLSAYLAARRRSGGRQRYQPRPMIYFSVQDALQRVGRLLRSLPDWASLERFLPEGLEDGVPRRAALSATLLAGLEMARHGQLDLRQDESFGPILIKQKQERNGFDG